MRGQDATKQPDAQTFKTNSLFASRRPKGSVGDDDSDDANRPLSDGEIYGLLKSPRRRFVLWYLRNAEGPLSLGELAEQTAAWENEKDVVDVDSAERKRAYVALYQCHLPKLDEVDAVDFDEDRKLVDAGSNYERLERATLGSTDDAATAPSSFARYYLLLAAVGLALVGGSVLVSRPFDAVSTPLVAAVIAAFGVLATWDFLQSTEDPLDAVRRAFDRDD